MTIATIAVLSAWYLAIGAAFRETMGDSWRPARWLVIGAWPVWGGIVGALSVWAALWDRGQQRRLREIRRGRTIGTWPPPPPPRRRGRK